MTILKIGKKVTQVRY